MLLLIYYLSFVCMAYAADMIFGEFDPLPIMRAGGFYNITWKITENANQALLFNFKQDCQDGAAGATLIFSVTPETQASQRVSIRTDADKINTVCCFELQGDGYLYGKPFKIEPADVFHRRSPRDLLQAGAGDFFEAPSAPSHVVDPQNIGIGTPSTGHSLRARVTAFLQYGTISQAAPQETRQGLTIGVAMALAVGCFVTVVLLSCCLVAFSRVRRRLYSLNTPSAASR